MEKQAYDKVFYDTQTQPNNRTKCSRSANRRFDFNGIDGFGHRICFYCTVFYKGVANEKYLENSLNQVLSCQFGFIYRRNPVLVKQPNEMFTEKSVHPFELMSPLNLTMRIARMFNIFTYLF